MSLVSGWWKFWNEHPATDLPSGTCGGEGFENICCLALREMSGKHSLEAMDHSPGKLVLLAFQPG